MRTYSEEEKEEVLEKLVENNFNYSATAKQTGVPRTTISSWARQLDIEGEIAYTLGVKISKLLENLPQSYASDGQYANVLCLLMDRYAKLLERLDRRDQSPPQSDIMLAFQNLSNAELDALTKQFEKAAKRDVPTEHKKTYLANKASGIEN
jgi:transposase